MNVTERSEAIVLILRLIFKVTQNTDQPISLYAATKNK
jgi:hypothetical protein